MNKTKSEMAPGSAAVNNFSEERALGQCPVLRVFIRVTGSSLRPELSGKLAAGDQSQVSVDVIHGSPRLPPKGFISPPLPRGAP